ncbi:glycoside hydrolase superfamily [Massariosphaeria phaeospora]|uniref:glucan 1,3-beta-glucosidase n=1 Tax=Massariosphaeria phaeospora TaxID=100035 RepID=A0A7C8MAE2_9PLEO|nr:glycoside hydrolase superfamily [Massariosphaeria phaeospora]
MPRGDPDPDPDRQHRRRERRESRGEDSSREQRRRRGHRPADSQGDLLPRPARRSRHQSDSEWDSPSPRKKRHSAAGGSTPTGSGSRSRDSAAPLSLEALAKLDKHNQKKAGRGYDYDEDYLKEVREKEARLEKERMKAEREEKKKEREQLRQTEDKRRAYESDIAVQEEARIRKEERRKERERPRQQKKPHTDDERDHRKSAHTDDERDRRKRHEQNYTPSERADRREKRKQEKQTRTEQKKRRVISGPLAEEGGVDDDEYHYMMEKRGGAGSEPAQYTEEQLAKRKKIKRILIGVVSVLILLAIIIPVAVMMSNKNSKENPQSEAVANTEKPANKNLDGLDPNSVPAADKGGILDPWAWWDTEDFNVTYTSEKVGGLPIIGLSSSWNDDVQANEHVPNLKDTFEYGKMKIRGVNVGGWLNLEPFITPSFFERYNEREVIDEYTLCKKLGPQRSKETLEKHYSAFVTKQTFTDIRDAGFDHVRIPFGYWMVETYEGDPYVSQVAWRYLLRGIEYARQNGLRINLDLHGAPGSQNGWNHSGRQGTIGWLNGTDGDLNAQRTLDVHHKLSQFFAQPRYKNIVTMYGIVNEPRMVDMNTDMVLDWTQKAIDQIRKDKITAVLVFGDGFLGLDNWQGKLTKDDRLLLDVHQYAIFNIDQLSLRHKDKLNFACKAWTQQSLRSMDRKTGFGPTMCGEWSQADTDCTKYINNVGVGTRWEGHFDTGNASTAVLKPQCPADRCSCAEATADAASYSEPYKKWLYQFAVAQMESFEQGWGWFYWTWETEKAPQWSWKLGMQAGILPKKVWEREWTCPADAKGYDSFEGLPENY